MPFRVVEVTASVCLSVCLLGDLVRAWARPRHAAKAGVTGASGCFAVRQCPQATEPEVDVESSVPWPMVSALSL